jgi:hypothetical protein
VIGVTGVIRQLGTIRHPDAAKRPYLITKHHQTARAKVLSCPIPVNSPNALGAKRRG